jgi:hypothetical protein
MTNTQESLDKIIRDGDPQAIIAAIEWGLRDPNLRAEIGRALDLLIAQRGYCEGEATAAADGILTVLRGHLEFRQRSEAA